MDGFGQKIIAALEENARQSVSAIAKQVNLSRTAVSERIKRLEDNGEILGYQVLTKIHAQETNQLKAYFEIKQGGYKSAALVQYLLQYPEVKHCHATSGQVDLLVHLEFSNMERLHDIIFDVDKELPKGAKLITHMVVQEWNQNN